MPDGEKTGSARDRLDERRKRREQEAREAPKRKRAESDTPPGAASEESEGPSIPARSRSASRNLETRLEEFFGGVAVAIAATGDPVCSRHVARQAKPLASAWNNLARENPRVRKIIERALSGGAWGEVILVTSATVIPIAAHHGLLPDSFPVPFSFGIGVPESEEVRQQQQQGPPPPSPPPPPPADNGTPRGAATSQPPPTGPEGVNDERGRRRDTGG